MEQQYKYYAFISYKREDEKWAKWLQHKLEHYKLPSNLNGRTDLPREIRPVFRDTSELNPGNLPQQIHDALAASRHLIVICSPHSAQSEWVNLEIETFIAMGKQDCIIPFIIEGSPFAKDPAEECFPPAIRNLPKEQELLGTNINEMGRDAAAIKTVAQMFGLRFDSLWKRHRRWLIRKTIAWILGTLAVLATLVTVWVMNQPVDIQVRLNETSVYNDNLPPLKDAVVTIALENKTEEDTIRTMDGEVVFTNIPHHFLNKKVHVTVVCRDFIPVDTTVALTQTIVLNIARDPEVFGNIHFYIYDRTAEKYISDVSVNIDGHIVSSDSDGLISLTLPLELQRKVYSFSSSIPLHQNYIPMPCGKRDCMYYR